MLVGAQRIGWYSAFDTRHEEKTIDRNIEFRVEERRNGFLESCLDL